MNNRSTASQQGVPRGVDELFSGYPHPVGDSEGSLLKLTR
jgi:hypothetical protein